MDLLVLESINDDPVVKSSMKSTLTSVTTVNTARSTPQDNGLGRRSKSDQLGALNHNPLTHTATNTSTISNGTTSTGKTMVTTTLIEGQDQKTMYPFRVKHLGKTEVYALYAPTSQNRDDWCNSIILAKQRHAASLYAQNAEPFRLRIMADTAFAYNDSVSTGQRPIRIEGTPLDRAITEVELSFRGEQRPLPVCRAQVNCATAFQQPIGKKKVAIGTDFGVFISDYENARGWTRAIVAPRVTQIAVLEEFSLFLIISEKALIAYHLDNVCPVSGAPNASAESSRRAPQKLSGNRDVGFFATGRMKDRTLVFYKKRDGISSTFKVLEPVYQKSSVPVRNRFGIKKGTTEFFRDFDEFYIPSETYTINLFHSSLAVATMKGFEVLTLDKKVPSACSAPPARNFCSSSKK
jgi:hypothetical protein